MRVELCSPEEAEAKAWDGYVSDQPGAAHSHLSAWRRVIQRSYGHAGFYLWAHEAGKLRGILPLVLIPTGLFGRWLVSMPFLDDGGVCADDAATRVALYEHAARLCGELRADGLDLRHRAPTGLALPLHGGKVTLRLELAERPDRMWARFDAKLRNQIRKAQRSELTACWTGLEGLSAFYEVFATNMRDLGTPVHSRGFFAAVLEEFQDSVRLVLVRQGRKTIAGGVCVAFRDTLLVPWASSLRHYWPACPNHLLYWEVIRWGCEKGYRRLDFGRSSPGSGPYRFKQQWGATEEPLHWQFLTRRHGSTPMAQAGDSRYGWACWAWKRLPVQATKVLGPMVRRHLSN